MSPMTMMWSLVVDLFILWFNFKSLTIQNATENTLWFTSLSVFGLIHSSWCDIIIWLRAQSVVLCNWKLILSFLFLSVIGKCQKKKSAAVHRSHFYHKHCCLRKVWHQYYINWSRFIRSCTVTLSICMNFVKIPFNLQQNSSELLKWSAHFSIAVLSIIHIL